MSVSTGTPSSRFTRSSTSSPSSSPGPRKLALLERFALSKLALKTYVEPELVADAFHVLRDRQAQLRRLDHARAGDDEEGERVGVKSDIVLAMT